MIFFELNKICLIHDLENLHQEDRVKMSKHDKCLGCAVCCLHSLFRYSSVNQHQGSNFIICLIIQVASYRKESFKDIYLIHITWFTPLYIQLTYDLTHDTRFTITITIFWTKCFKKDFHLHRMNCGLSHRCVRMREWVVVFIRSSTKVTTLFSRPCLNSENQLRSPTPSKSIWQTGVCERWRQVWGLEKIKNS